MRKISKYVNLMPSEINSKSEGTPFSTPTSNWPMSLNDWQIRVAHQDQNPIHTELQTEKKLAHQYWSAYPSVCKMAMYKEVMSLKAMLIPNKCGYNKAWFKT